MNEVDSQSGQAATFSYGGESKLCVSLKNTGSTNSKWHLLQIYIIFPPCDWGVIALHISQREKHEKMLNFFEKIFKKIFHPLKNGWNECIFTVKRTEIRTFRNLP